MLIVEITREDMYLNWFKIGTSHGDCFLLLSIDISCKVAETFCLDILYQYDSS